MLKESDATNIRPFLIKSLYFFTIKSNDITENDLEKVLKLAEEKYCPVWNMLNKELKIETKFNLIAEDCLTGPSS
jgi:uncharacterized OsmC-like protein